MPIALVNLGAPDNGLLEMVSDVIESWEAVQSSNDICADCFPLGRGGRLGIRFRDFPAVKTTVVLGLFVAGENRCYRCRASTGIVSGWCSL